MLVLLSESLGISFGLWSPWCLMSSPKEKHFSLFYFQAAAPRAGQARGRRKRTADGAAGDTGAENERTPAGSWTRRYEDKFIDNMKGMVFSIKN